MSAAMVLARAEAEGITLRLAGGRIDMKADRQPPADLLAALRENRDGVVRLLEARERPEPPPPQQSRDNRADAAAPPPADPPSRIHDEAEEAARAAMAAFYAQPGRDHNRPDREDPDYPARYRPTPESLVMAASLRPTAWAEFAATPSPGSCCSCCDGRRWWGDPRGWRCAACHPPPPGITDTTEKTT